MTFLVFLLLTIFAFFLLVCFLSFVSFNSTVKSVNVLVYSLVFIFIVFFVFFTTMFSNPYLIPLLSPFFTVYSTSVSVAFFLGFSCIIFSILFFSGPFNQFSSQNLMGFFFFLVAVAASFSLLVVSDFIIFVIFSELLAISSYLLIFFNNTHSHFVSSFKYLIINAIGTLFILAGLTFAHFYFGVNDFLNLFYIFENAPLRSSEMETGYLLFNFFFWLGLIIKFGLFPFHYWVFDIYENSSKFAVIFFSTFLKLPFFPIIISALKSATYYVVFCLCIVGFISVLYASIFSVRAFLTNKKKFSFRRLMAYSSINNFGLLFLILPTSRSVTLFYLFSYFLATLFVFLAYFDIADFETKDELRNFYTSPTNESFFYLTAHKYSYNMFCVSIIVTSGLPLFGLFFPKFVLFGALLNSTGFVFQHGIIFAIALLVGGFFFVYVYYKFSFSGWFTFPHNYLDRFDTLKSDENSRSKKFTIYLRIFCYYVLGLAFILVPYVLYYYIL